MRLPLHVSVHIYDHLQGAREQHFVQLLSLIPLMYVRCVLCSMRPYVITVCNITVPLECLNLHNTLNINKMERSAYKHDQTYRFVCVSGAAVRVRSGHGMTMIL